MKIGDKIRLALDHAIHLQDKLLLILSKRSIESQWVEQEVEKALEKERKENRLVLLPIRVDDTVFQVEVGWVSYLRNSRNIGDFGKWMQYDEYQNSFNRLLRDLKAS